MMIERVAMAIAASKRGLAMDDPALVKIGPGYIGQARAAIAAMREPTEAMVQIGMREAGQMDTYLDWGGSRIVWQAMIDEALR